MAGELPVLVKVGVPGPAGTGITPGDWATINSRVDNLYIPTASPMVDGAARSSTFVTNSTVPVLFGESIITFSGLNAVKAHKVTAWCSADITSPSGNIANMAVTISSGTYVGTYYQTPTGAGTYPAIAGLGITFPPGVPVGSFTVRPIVYSSTAVNITFANVRVWASVEPIG